MTDVVRDFNILYTNLKEKYNLSFYLNCTDKNNNVTTLKCLQERKSYLCCATDTLGKCVFHKCIPIIFGTILDKQFRLGDEADYNDCNSYANIVGTFMIDGRNLSFPNILMNNNILVHNFYDKLYSKSCKRMFLYGNFDEEKKINRAIQLVYDKHDDVLFARDVYARDYIVTENLNTILHMYLQKSGKWEPLNFLFAFKKFQINTLVDQIKRIMRNDINYSIDSLANKIIYKHDYLLNLIYKPILKMYEILSAQNDKQPESKKRKIQTILYPRECKKIVETIVNGKLIYIVSKTFSKQRKNFINYQDNSSNNNIEINPPLLKYRIGNEVVRITNDTMRQDMLMQQSDFVMFVDSFFHGEMTVAGKKFFLCRHVRLPSVDYEMVRRKFLQLIEEKLIFENNENDFDDIETDSTKLAIAFNDRPTIYLCQRANLYKIFYIIKRELCPIELKLANNILFVNHHEGMVCIKRTIRINFTKVKINTLLTPYEYHNESALLKINRDIGELVENNDVSCLMSKLVQYYYRNVINIFSTVPVPKLIVSLTNLKNAMPVLADASYDNAVSSTAMTKFYENLPNGNSVVVAPHIQINNKMFKLWTLVRDNRLETAEDPYIPAVNLPIYLYNNKINKLKGKLMHGKHETPSVKFFANETDKNCMVVDGGMFLHMAGVIVSNVKINWIYDGKRYKIESCKNKTHYVAKIYIYVRQLKNQMVKKVQSKLNITNDTVYLKLIMITQTNDLQGLKICGIHGQKGVLSKVEDLTEWMAEDGTSAQICLSPISFLSRQSNFDDVEKKYVVRGGDFTNSALPRYPIFLIPYMFFNNTPDNIFKEFLKINHTGHEKVEGTRLDQWTINQSFAGNRLAESLQCIRGNSNLPDNSGEFNVMSSLLHCNNTIMQ